MHLVNFKHLFRCPGKPDNITRIKSMFNLAKPCLFQYFLQWILKEPDSQWTFYFLHKEPQRVYTQGQGSQQFLIKQSLKPKNFNPG